MRVAFDSSDTKSFRKDSVSQLSNSKPHATSAQNKTISTQRQLPHFYHVEASCIS